MTANIVHLHTDASVTNMSIPHWWLPLQAGQNISGASASGASANCRIFMSPVLDFLLVIHTEIS